MTQKVDNRSIAIADRDDSFVAVSWQDKAAKPTNFLTNIEHENGYVIEVERRHKGQSKKDIIPLIAYHYTEHGMGSVDTFNQNLKNTTPPRRNFSWKRTAFMSLLSFTLVNLWVVHKQRHEEPIPLGKFLDLMKYDFTSDHTTQLQQRKILKRAERNNIYNQQHKIIANVEHKRKHVEAVKKYKEKRKATLVHTVDEKL